MLQGAAAASCALVGDFSTGTSYGTLPCNSCPSFQPICLAIQDQTKGICTCLQTPPTLQSCRRADLADRVFPDASQLCAISLDYRRLSTQTITSLDWNALATAPCILVSPSNAYCYNVPGYGPLVVGLGIVDASYRRRRRHLLSFSDDHDPMDPMDPMDDYQNLRHSVMSFILWNATLARPCSTLAHAITFEANLSITDMHTLRSCVEWRQIGRDAIRHLNITSIRPGSHEEEEANRLFMSLEDFASVVSSRYLILTPSLFKKKRIHSLLC